MARKRRAEQPLVRRPALADPKNLSKPQAVAVKGSTKTALRNVGASRTRPRPLRTTLICAAGLLVLSAGILAAGPIAGHLPDIILGLCIVILGMLFGVLLAVRS